MTQKNNNQLITLLDISSDIAERSPKDANSLVFMARPFVQTTLPHRDPGKVPEWHRKNGRLTLSIRPGWGEDPKTGEQKPIGIPFGTIPRLLLIWMSSEALKTGKPVLELGSSLSSFMKQIGLDPDGRGINSPAYRLKDQMQRLFRSTISLDETSTNENGRNNRWLDMQVVFQGNMSWFDTNDPRFNSKEDKIAEEIYGSWIELNPIFYQSITHSSVPLDMRIIQEIKQSPLALDLYAWMTHRTHGQDCAPVDSSRLKPSFISWKQLHDQFGSNYKNTKDFKKEVKPLLRLVQALSNNLALEEAEGGINISQKMSRIK